MNLLIVFPEEVADGLNIPIFHEVTKANGAPLLWAFLSVAAERNDDILQGYILKRVMMRMKTVHRLML